MAWNQLLAAACSAILLIGWTPAAFAQQAQPPAAAVAGLPAGAPMMTNGPDDSQPLGDAPAGGFVPIPLPDGCSAYLMVQKRFDALTKSSVQPNGRTWLEITPHVACNGQETAIAALPQATLDAACQDALAKYQAQSSTLGMVLTAKDYLCPKLDDPFFLS